MRNNYWLAMDIHGHVYVYCDDCQFHPVYPSKAEMALRIESSLREPRPWKFDGSECVTKDCIPEWAIDTYYEPELPKTFQECSGR